MDKQGVTLMPRIQINRIESTELATYGRCLYPGELMIIRGERRNKDLVLLGVNDFDSIYTKPTENGPKVIVTGTTVVNSYTGDYSYNLTGVLNIENANTGMDGLRFSRLSDNTDVVSITDANTLACSKRPIIVGLAPDFMSYQKKDEVALVSDLDGAWTSKNSNILRATAVGTYEVDLSSYLPNDNNVYEILISNTTYNSQTESSTISVKTSLVAKINILNAQASGRHPCNTFSIPVGADRVLTYYIENAASSALVVYALAYKRTK